jgi:hypothetical protein
LRVDVAVRTDGVSVYAHPADAPDPCQNAFLLPGNCDTMTDAVSCDGDVTPWVTSMRLERDGAVLDERAPDEDFRAELEADSTDGSELVLDGNDSSQMRIAIPAVVAPVPTIDEVVVDDTTVTTTWHSDPAAASAMFLLSDGMAPPRCHVEGSVPGVLPAPMYTGASLYLNAYAAPVTRATDYGDVVFWYSGSAFQADVNPI